VDHVADELDVADSLMSAQLRSTRSGDARHSPDPHTTDNQKATIVHPERSEGVRHGITHRRRCGDRLDPNLARVAGAQAKQHGQHEGSSHYLTLPAAT
jgi:hypothetical protein